MRTIAKTSFRAAALALVSGLAYLTACERTESNPQSTVTTKTITAQGGSVTAADNQLTVTLPAGAVNANTEVSIEKTNEVAPKGIGNVYRITPEGTTFSKLVTISFKYTDADAAETDPALMAICYRKADGTWQQTATTKIDRQTKTIHAATTHFSEWALIAQTGGMSVDIPSLGSVYGIPVTLDYYPSEVNGKSDTVFKLVSVEGKTKDFDFIIFAQQTHSVNKGKVDFIDFFRLQAGVKSYNAYQEYPENNPEGYVFDFGSMKREDFRKAASINVIEVAMQSGEYTVGDFTIPVILYVNEDFFSRKVEMMTGYFRVKKT